jgi:hypothetical protein
LKKGGILANLMKTPAKARIKKGRVESGRLNSHGDAEPSKKASFTGRSKALTTGNQPSEGTDTSVPQSPSSFN